MTHGNGELNPGDCRSVRLITPQVTCQTDEVIHCRLQQRNMVTTVEKLQLCIPGTTADRGHWISRVITSYPSDLW